MATEPDTGTVSHADGHGSAQESRRAQQLQALGMRPDTPRTARTVVDVEELHRGKRAPSTSDEVTILKDGRRIETLADAKAWIAEMDAQRCASTGQHSTR